MHRTRCLLIAFALACAACTTAPPAAVPSPVVAAHSEPPRPLTSAAAKVQRIGGYDFALPSWWDEEQPQMPQLADEDAVRKYVTAECGADTGTPQTWRKALKIWALAAQRLGLFPVYVGHAYAAGHQWADAARVFGELYALAPSQGDKADWNAVYLAYNAGEAYRRLRDGAQSAAWYERAARFSGSADDALRYYAEKSRRLAELMRAGRFEEAEESEKIRQTY